MSIKRFRIETPEQLRAVSEFCLYGALACRSRATVWSAVRNGKGNTPWDNSFCVEFHDALLGSHNAYIMQDNNRLAQLERTEALAYCRKSLQLIEEVAG